MIFLGLTEVYHTTRTPVNAGGVVDWRYDQNAADVRSEPWAVRAVAR